MKKYGEKGKQLKWSMVKEGMNQKSGWILCCLQAFEESLGNANSPISIIE